MKRFPHLGVTSFAAGALTLAGLLAVNPVCAQLYRWVDQRGVTNYSNQPPADPAALGALRQIEDRIPAYTAEAIRKEEVERAQHGRDRIGMERNARQDAGLDAARQSPQYGPPPPPDPCANSNLARCSATRANTFPYDASSGFYPDPLQRSRRTAHPDLIPGTTAGNVVGTNGFIPGYSTSRSAQSAPAPGTFPEAPLVRSDRRR